MCAPNNLLIFGSGNGLSPVLCQVITWTNYNDFSSICPLGRDFCDICWIKKILCRENAFENIVCKTVAILFKPQ